MQNLLKQCLIKTYAKFTNLFKISTALRLENSVNTIAISIAQAKIKLWEL